MSETSVFDRACANLESATPLTRLEVRGTVRLALKAAGLDARTVTAEQLRVVAERVLPGELESRGVRGASDICRDLAAELATLHGAASADTPEAVFERLGGGS